MKQSSGTTIWRVAVLAAVVLATLSIASAQTMLTITASAGPGGQISPNGKVSVPKGGSQLFTITPITGYDILKVLVNGKSMGAVASYTLDNVQKNSTIKALFKIKTFSLTFSAADGVKIVPSGSKTYKYGAVVKVTVTPPKTATNSTPLLTLDGNAWPLLPAGKSFTSIIGVLDTHVVHARLPARFNEAVTKAGDGGGTVTSAPAGISCGTVCSAGFDESSSVTLTAKADTKSTFTGWSGGGCSGTGTCQVTLNADTTITATFAKSGASKKSLTVAKTGTGAGAVSSNPSGIDCGTTCTAPFDQASSVTLTAHADTGSAFGGWAGGGCSGTGTCKVTLNADTTVTATFTSAATGSLKVRVVDDCDNPSSGAIVVVHDSGGHILQKFTTDATGIVDLSSFGSLVTFTVGWPNGAVANASIKSFVEVPGTLGTFTVPIEGGNCPPSDPLLGTVTVDLPNQTAGAVFPFNPGVWTPVFKTFDVYQHNLQNDGKLTFLANNVMPGQPGPFNYGFLLDQAFTNGASYTVTLDKTTTDVLFRSQDNLSNISISGPRKGQTPILGQLSMDPPAQSGTFPLFRLFPADSFVASAFAPILVAANGSPYSNTTWTRVMPNPPTSLVIRSLLKVTDYTYDSTALQTTWVLSDNSPGKIGYISASHVDSGRPRDDRKWIVVLDPTTHATWGESSLTLPPEFSLAGRTVESPGIAVADTDYIKTYSNALKALFAGGVTPPAGGYELTYTERSPAP